MSWLRDFRPRKQCRLRRQHPIELRANHREIFFDSQLQCPCARFLLLVRA